MMYLNEAIIAAIFTGFGVLLRIGIEYVRTKSDVRMKERKQREDSGRSAVEQAVKMYQDIAIGLRDDLKQMVTNLNSLEADHLACREENAFLRAEMKGLNERVQTLEKELRSRRAE
jgi:septal ring factor EnvC (AmiA/AmiB activator)